MKITCKTSLLMIFGCMVIVQSFSGCKNENRVQGVSHLTPGSKPSVTAVHPMGSAGKAGHGALKIPFGHADAETIVFSLAGSVAYVEPAGEGRMRVVHNGRTGNSYEQIENITLSRDGDRIAYGARKGNVWSMVADGKEENPADGIGPAKFSSDGKHVAYTVKRGEQWHLVVDGRVSNGFPSIDDLYFSADPTSVILLENAKSHGGLLRITILDLQLREKFIKELRATAIALTEERSRMAAVVSDDKGKQRVAELDFLRPDVVIAGPTYDSITHPAYGRDGKTLVFIAEKGGERYLVMGRKKELLPAGEVSGLPVIRPDNQAVGVILSSSNGSMLHQAFVRDGAAGKPYEEISGLTYDRDGGRYAYVARQGGAEFVVVNGKEGPKYDRIVSPAFSPDGKWLVCRARKDGKRFVVVNDGSGKVVKRHSAYEMVFPVVFVDEGTAVAYGVKEGQMLVWKKEVL